MVELINLTPHAIVIVGNPAATIAPSGTVARCSVKREKVADINYNGAQIPVNKTVFGDVEGLPEPKDNTFYIVSSIVAAACPYRNDLLITDDAVRDDNGNIIGCRALAVKG